VTERRRLVGRGEELAELERAFDAAARGSGRVVLVEGEPGIGKTALVRAGLAGAAGTGLTVAWGGTDPMETHRPFGVLLDALAVEAGSPDPRRADIATRLSSRRPSGLGAIEEPGDVAFAVGEAILDLVEELCSAGPVALVLEDLQWADPASLVVLPRLGRRASQLSLALVCTLRPRPRPAELTQLVSGLLATGAARRLALGTLAAPDVAALVEQLLGEPPEPSLLAQVAGAGGNPLFITELVAVLHKDDGVDAGAAASAGQFGTSTPPSLGLTILSHVSALAPATQELLGLASVLGTHFSVSDLAEAAGRPVGALTSSLREAMEAGVLGEEGERLVFRHELIREALYGDLPRPLRAGLHADIARRLGEGGAPAASVAEHLLRAGTAGSDSAAWLHRAATEVAPASPAVAIRMWERALTLPGTPEVLSREMEVGLALALIEVGEVNAAQERCERLLASAGIAGHIAVVRACLAQAVMLQGQIERARAEADRALSEGLSPHDEARLLAWSSLLPFYAGDLEGAMAAGRRAERAGRLAADTSSRVQGLVTQSHVAFFRGQYAASEQLARQAAALADADGSPEAHRADPHLWLAVPLSQTDRMGEAEAEIRRGRQAAAVFGSRNGVVLGYLAETNVHFHCGRFADADAELEAAASLAEDTGMAWHATLAAVRGLIALRQAGPERARAVAGLEDPPSLAHRSFGRGSLAQTWVAYLVATGQRERALTVGWEAWEGSEAAGMGGDQAVFGPDLAAVAVAAEDRSLASTIASRLEALADANPGVASLAGVAGRARGLADDDPNVLLAALESYRASPRVYDQARTAEEAAVLLVRAGRRTEAEPLAGEAHRLYVALDLQWEDSRARRALREAGLHFGARGARSRPTTGWASLTATENRVAGLVTEGLSNPAIAERLFLSRRTVESHVSHILAKLGLHSRVELAAAGARRGAVGVV
jgi:DNA-binding CsgD family transcriptional regulator/tetratricopeptide (TPR) repeat protein